MNLFLLLYVSNNFWAFDYKLANGRTLTNNTEQGYQVLYLSHTFLLQKLLNSLKDKKFRRHLQLKSHQHQKELGVPFTYKNWSLDELNYCRGNSTKQCSCHINEKTSIAPNWLFVLLYYRLRHNKSPPLIKKTDYRLLAYRIFPRYSENIWKVY